MSALTIDLPAPLLSDGDAAAVKLAAWITAQGIKADDSAEAAAGRVLAEIHHSYVTGWLTSGNTVYLRSACERYGNTRPQADAEWCAEDNRDGHGPDDSVDSMIAVVMAGAR